MEQHKTDKCNPHHEAERSTEKNLFSFELIVDSVSQLSVECVAPAIGFRLLDYPTVIIYHTSQVKLNNLKTTSDDISASQSSDRRTCNENIPDLKEDGGIFHFHRGKSTLFSMDLNKLFQLLSKIPVYIMLLDMWTAETRLVGSCVLSLKTAIEEMNLSIQSKAHNVPAFYSTKVSTSIFNLMGTVVGKLSGKFTLYSYGNTLSKHVLEEKSSKSNVDVILNKPEKSSIPKGTGKVTSEKLAERIQKFDKSTETTAFQQKYDGDSKISQLPNLKSQHVEKGTRFSKKKVIAKDGKKIKDIVMEPGTSYPPPLFYNSEADNAFQNISKEGAEKQPHQSTNYHIFEAVNAPTKGNFLVKQVSDIADVNHELLQPYERARKITQTKQHQKANGERDMLECKARSPIAEENALNAIIKSLDEMPLLQGIMKEIIKFSITQKGLQNGRSSAEGDGIHKTKCICQQEKLSKGVSKSEIQTKGKVSIPAKHKPPERNLPKKLKFKTTKSHQLRCAMHSNTGSSNRAAVFEYLETNGSIEEEAYSQKGVEYAKGQSDHMQDSKHQNDGRFGKQHKSPSHKERQSRRNSDVRRITKGKRKNLDTEDVVDAESDAGHVSLKSKSPVSLEIHLPSTLGSEEAEMSDDDLKTYPESVDSNSRGYTGIYSPAPLEKKWTGLDDLSRMKQSTDGILFDPSNNSGQFRSSSRLSGTDNQGFSSREEQASLINHRPVKCPERYSDEFEASSDDSASRKSDQSAGSPTFVASYNSKSSSHSSLSQSKRRIEEITRRQQTELSVSDKLDSVNRQGSERSTLSRESHSKTSSVTQSVVSNRSLPRNAISNSSKPVMSAHSPTTSRSLRNKARHSFATSDDLTRTVDMSTDLSSRRSENDQPSFSEDEHRESHKTDPSKDDDDESRGNYSDDFENAEKTSSDIASIVTDHRSPTPRHVILSQARLGYTM